MVLAKQRWLYDVWTGNTSSAAGRAVRLPLARALPAGVQVPLSELAWATCMVGPRGRAGIGVGRGVK